MVVIHILLIILIYPQLPSTVRGMREVRETTQRRIPSMPYSIQKLFLTK
jgi:hypothetical protein